MLRPSLMLLKNLVAILISNALIGCSYASNATEAPLDIDHTIKVPYYADWPQIHSSIKKDEDIENLIVAILSQMTLEEKVGQMIQPNLPDVTPEEAKEYKLGWRCCMNS
jgi:beta-glucosidase